MTWLLEDPWVIVAVGGLLEVILIAGLFKTGRGVLLWPIALVAAVTAGLVALERYVVTEKEEVAAVLHAVSRDLKADDRAAVLSHISEHAPEIRRAAEMHLRVYRVEEIRIKPNLEVLFREGSDPRRAQARFNAVVVGGDRAGMLTQRQLPLLFTVELRREGERWRVSHYEVQSPQHGTIVNSDDPVRDWSLPRDTR